jgi:beta-glucanase (GH16 family)
VTRPTAGATAQGEGAAGPGRRRLVWSDEFDGPAGAPADPSIWTHELGDGSLQGIAGWGNSELQHYTDEPANAVHDGLGNLVVTARRTSVNGNTGYTSARLVTKGKLEVAHGWIEARARVPRGAGLWPAVWALGASIDDAPWPACGEIDLMEHVGREPRRAFGTIHGPGYSGDAGVVGTVDLERDLADDFHVFAIDWAPGSIAWYLDGVRFHRATRADVAPNAWVFDDPFFLLLNLAVGGTFGGPVDEQTAFPAELLVDYVRVYAP